MLLALGACTNQTGPAGMSELKISDNHRYFCDEKGDPFFWLGDTGWLLFAKLTREEACTYLDDRVAKGFNVIQVMVLHSVGVLNAYGDTALTGGDVARPLVTEGKDPADSLQYDYWDHVDYIVGEAEKRGLYMALVPVWGSNVKAGLVSRQQASAYAAWLGGRYGERPNIVWLNGGDIPGSDSTEVWKTLGEQLRQSDPHHLITFHPRGRMQSSDWFHQEEWLDFNMFQSGHRRYDQDDTERCYGEDNWRYAEVDYRLTPVKPTLDGEPSYEGIPQGLHDTLQPLWQDNDVRRYAYWSVFAGACGYTYGHSSVMQFRKPSDRGGAYGAKKSWEEAINDPGASQMVHLKTLMLSRPYFERIPDQSLVAEQPGDKYNYQLATRGNSYAMVYTYNGREIRVDLQKTTWPGVKASWFNPRDGSSMEAGEHTNSGVVTFDPPGEPADGNDWVLVLDSAG